LKNLQNANEIGTVMGGNVLAGCEVGSVDICGKESTVCFTDNCAYIETQTGGRLKINGAEYLDENGRIQQFEFDDEAFYNGTVCPSYSIRKEVQFLYKLIKNNFMGYFNDEVLIKLEYDEPTTDTRRVQYDVDELLAELGKFKLKYIQVIEPNLEGNLRIKLLIRNYNDDCDFDELFERLALFWHKGTFEVIEDFRPLELYKELNPFLNSEKKHLIEKYNDMFFYFCRWDRMEWRPYVFTMPYDDAVRFLMLTGYKRIEHKRVDILVENLDEDINNLVSSQLVEYFIKN